MTGYNSAPFRYVMPSFYVALYKNIIIFGVSQQTEYLL